MQHDAHVDAWTRAPHSVPSKMLVLPSRSLIELVLRAVRRGATRYNYAVVYRDVRGYGLQLAVARWALRESGRQGRFYAYIND